MTLLSYDYITNPSTMNEFIKKYCNKLSTEKCDKIFKYDDILHRVVYSKKITNNNKKKLIKCLMKYCDINKQGKSKTTPLLVSVFNNNYEIAKFLLKNGANPNIKNKYFDSPIEVVSKKKNYKIVKLLIIEGKINLNDYKYLLLNATFKNDKILAKILLENGADPNVQFNYEKSRKNTSLNHAVINNNFNMAELLLKYKANPNIKNRRGNTPLSIAVKKDNYNMVKLLLKYDANPNIQDKKGISPILFAVNNEYYDIAKLLIKRGKTDININKTILHKAVIENNKTMIKFLLNNKVNINMQDRYGNTALHEAVKHNNYEITVLLLYYGANYFIPNYNGLRPYNIAVKNKIIL